MMDGECLHCTGHLSLQVPRMRYSGQTLPFFHNRAKVSSHV